MGFNGFWNIWNFCWLRWMQPGIKVSRSNVLVEKFHYLIFDVKLSIIPWSSYSTQSSSLMDRRKISLLTIENIYYNFGEEYREMRILAPFSKTLVCWGKFPRIDSRKSFCHYRKLTTHISLLLIIPEQKGLHTVHACACRRYDFPLLGWTIQLF